MLYTHVKETHALVTQFLSGCRLNVMAEEQFVNLTELMDFKSLKFTQKQVEVACLVEGKQSRKITLLQ